MARHHKDFVTKSKDVLDYLRRTTYYLKGKHIQESAAYADALYLWYLAIIDILDSHGGHSLHRVESIIKDISKQDVFIVGTELKRADALLVTYCAFHASDCCSYESFKQTLPNDVSHFVRALFGLTKGMFRPPIGEFLGSIRTILCFITRVNIKSPELEAIAIEKFLGCEDRISSLAIPNSTGNDIISRWFPRSYRYQFESLIAPKHGPGAVSERCKSVAEKYRSLVLTPMGKVLLKDHVYDWWDLPDGNVPPARAIFVPKSLTSYRTICSEPATHQWLQQGIFYSLDRWLRYHPYLSKRIDLRDQGGSRDKAWLGSIDGSLATIDLSDASDSVSLSLIKEWFGKSALFEAMLCSRSRFIELPNGVTLKTAKFAPMGSALCFPTECIVFAALAELAIQEDGGRSHDSCYCVYGDDIIIERDYVNTLITLLGDHGFVVNVDKSHYHIDSRFRESCGGDYLDGYDVTPLRIGRRFRGLACGKRAPSSVLSLIDLANDCYNRLARVRLAVINHLMALPEELRPHFDNIGDGCLFSTTPTNYHVRTVWNKDWQTNQIISGSLKQSHSNLTQDEDIRLHEYLRTVNGRSRLTWPEDRVSLTVSPPGSLSWSSSRHHEIPVERGREAF